VIGTSQDGKQSFVIVACVGEEIVGFASGGRARDTSTGLQGEVGGLYILEHYQKKGIGRRLMDRLSSGCLLPACLP